MRLAHGRAGWALVTAGTVGMVLSASAQEPRLPVAPAAAPHLEKTADESKPPSPGLARLSEIRVELAWLSDPATFPCQLAARTVGTSLEVGGSVPNEVVRTRALRLAEEQSHLPVTDKLMIRANAVQPPSRVGHEKLSQATATVLSKAMARYKESFQFDADARGQITVSGVVPSCQEKLQISRRLSAVPGCTSVVNNLSIRPVVHGREVITLVSADGTFQVPGDPTQLLPGTPPVSVAEPMVINQPGQPPMVISQPGQPPMVINQSGNMPVQGPVVMMPSSQTTIGYTVQQPVPAPMPMRAAAAAPAPTATGPVSPYTLQPAASARPINPTPAPAVNVQPTANARPVTPPAAASTQTAPVALQSVPVLAPQVQTNARPLTATTPVAASTQTAPVRPAPPVASQQVPVPTVQGQMVASPLASSPPRMLAAPVVTASSAAPLAAPAQSVPVARPVQTAQAVSQPVQQVAALASPAQPPTAVQAAPTPAPSAPAAPFAQTQWSRPTAPAQLRTAQPIPTQAQPSAVVQASYQTTEQASPYGGMTARPATPKVQVAAAPQVAPAPPPAPPARPRPAVTKPASAAPGGQMSITQQVEVLRHIEEISKGAARGVHVECKGVDECTIRFKVHNEAEGRDIGPKVMKLPELAPYKVHLEVQVAP